MRVQFRADMTPLLGALRQAETDAAGIVEAGIDTTATAIAGAVIPIIQSETPVGEGPFHDPQHTLAGSTRASIVPTTDSALIAFRQPAQSKPNEDGSGGGFYYMNSVWHGRKAISAPSTGPYSTGKPFLRTPWGPRKSVKKADGKDYPEQSMALAAGPIAFVIRDGASTMAMRIAAGLGGAP